MEINITDVSVAQRHSTKYAPCWQEALLFHVAIPETTPMLPCFSTLANSLLAVAIIRAFSALVVHFLT